MLILADLGHDPKHWPSEAATAADKAFLVSRHRWLGTTLMRICHIRATLYGTDQSKWPFNTRCCAKAGTKAGTSGDEVCKTPSFTVVV